MDNQEHLLPNKYLWRGIEFDVTKSATGLRLLTVPNPHGEADYNACVEPIRDLNIQGINLINGLKLTSQRTTPTYTCAVVPSNQFMLATGIPSNFDWATVCSRAVWQDTKEDAVVVSSAHKKKIDFTTLTPINQFTEDQADVLREAIHEHLPTLRDTYLPYLSSSSLPISEAMDEVVPRYVIGLQKRMPASTHFLTSLSDEKILTIEDLWNSFSKHSSSPVSKNHAYGSAFLLGVGLLKQLQSNYGLVEKDALSLWLDTVIEATDGFDAVTKLADKLLVKRDVLWHGKELQKIGQNVILQDLVR